ncbi:MAG: GNAT family N-acetyltransferase [Lachnospiraceae bacterium]|nr:GNAT family N-acetyltransferase [Lachnospiraceae bacterium]
MQTIIYLAIREPYLQSYMSYIHHHLIKCIIKPLTRKDFSQHLDFEKAKTSHSSFSFLFCDSDASLEAFKDCPLPRIAVRHEGNASDSLMSARWLIDSPESISQDYLAMVHARYFELPLSVAVTPSLLLRELTYDDLTALIRLQTENIDNPDGCFFTDGLETAEDFLDDYIGNQYPFYDFGYYAIEIREKESMSAVRALQTMNPKYMHEEKIDVKLEEKYGVPVNPWVVGIAGFSMETIEGEPALDFGYSILSDWQGNGIATEAVMGLLGNLSSQNKIWRSPLFEETIQEIPIYVRVRKKNHKGVRFARRLFTHPERWMDSKYQFKKILYL